MQSDEAAAFEHDDWLNLDQQHLFPHDEFTE